MSASLSTAKKTAFHKSHYFITYCFVLEYRVLFFLGQHSLFRVKKDLPMLSDRQSWANASDAHK